MKPSTLLAQAFHLLDRETGAVVLPIHPSTTFERDPEYRGDRDYSRDKSPAYLPIERILTTLEGGAHALVFASGMAAAEAVLQSLRAGDHVVAPSTLYWGVRNRMLSLAEKGVLAVDFVDMRDLDALAACVKKGQTKLVWCETPANPNWDVTDIARASEIAHAVGAEIIVDSTAASPILSQPLLLGADYVLHSATKYLNGHSDVVAGALVTKTETERWKTIALYRREGGAVLGPFESWLLLRGMRTLDLRVREQSRTALALARFLASHRAVSEVLYPGLESHAGHEIASRQMKGGFGGMLSIRMKGGRDAALRVTSKVQVFVRATSLGGVESLIEHRKSVEGANSPVPEDLVRLSVGIEAEEDLRADLERALSE